MNTYIKDNKLIINAIDDELNKLDFIKLIDKFENKQVQIKKTYDIEGNIIGLIIF